MTDAIRVLLADDHTMLREGLRRSLTGRGVDIVGEASNGQQAVELTAQHLPQVVLMDVTMPVLGGLDATRRISERHPDVHVLILTMHADPQLARDASDAGAMGYLVKDCSTEDIIGAIQAATRGETTFPAVPPTPSSTSGSGSASTSGSTPGQAPLITAREAEVLQLIAEGKSTSEVASALFLSAKTVKNHLASAYAKLDTHDRTQAVLRAARLGLIKLDD